jgi:hypothetical protein
MADSMKALVITFLLIVLGLALTPAVGSFTVDASYTSYQEVTHLVPASSNTTTVTYNIRDSDEAYVSIIAWDNDDSNATVTGYTYVASGAKTIAITGIVPTGGSADRDFWLWITYSTIDLTSAPVLALVVIAPLLWVVLILAIGIVAIYKQLKHSTG